MRQEIYVQTVQSTSKKGQIWAESTSKGLDQSSLRREAFARSRFWFGCGRRLFCSGIGLRFVLVCWFFQVRFRLLRLHGRVCLVIVTCSTLLSLGFVAHANHGIVDDATKIHERVSMFFPLLVLWTVN